MRRQPVSAEVGKTTLGMVSCAPAPPQCGQLLTAAPPRCGQVGVLRAALQADSAWGATFEFRFDTTWYGDWAPCGGVCTNVGRRGVFSRSDGPLRWWRPNLCGYD